MKNYLCYSLILFFCFVLINCGGEDDTDPQPTPDPDPDPMEEPDLGDWSSGARMPTARKEIANATVALAGKIYVFGGVRSNGTITNSLEIYDIEGNSWTSGDNLEIPVWRACASAFGDDIYLFGGYTSLSPFPFNPTNRVFKYNTIEDTWSEQTVMPIQRGAAVAITANGLIHVIGGANDQALTRHDIYDPSNDTWSTGASMQIRRSGLTGTVLNNKIYVMGGYELGNGGVVVKQSVEIFDVVSGSRTSGTDMPISRLGIDAVAFDDKLYVFGGTSGSGISLTLAFDPAINEWKALEEMPNKVSFMGAAVGIDQIHVIGGGATNLNRTDGVNNNRKFLPPQ